MNTLQFYVDDNINKKAISNLSNAELKSLIRTNGLKTKLTSYNETFETKKYSYEDDNENIIKLQSYVRSSEILFEDYEDFEDINMFLKTNRVTTHHYS